MALIELRNKLPHGDVGRIVNSHIFTQHPDAVEEAREYWSGLRKSVPRRHRIFTVCVASVGIIRELGLCGLCQTLDCTAPGWLESKLASYARLIAPPSEVTKSDSELVEVCLNEIEDYVSSPLYRSPKQMSVAWEVALTDHDCSSCGQAMGPVVPQLLLDHFQDNPETVVEAVRDFVATQRT